jgi:quinol monooxygenase YgiN
LVLRRLDAEGEKMIAIVATLTVKDGHADKMAEVLIATSAAVRANEPGCRLYQVTRSRSDSNVFKVLEQYESERAFEAHRQAPHMGPLRAAFQEHLSAPPGIEILDAVG